MTDPVLVACLQTRPMASFDAAIDEALTLLDEAVARGASLVFLPEYAGGLASQGPKLAPPVAPDGAHPFVEAMQRAALETSVWILIGSVAVEGPSGMIINRGYLINDQGQIRGHYDKIHMFDIQLSETEVYRESATVVPGAEAVLLATPFGTIGHTICYDLRFPDLYRALAQGGAELLAAP
ncbi:MAG: nitrilase-related carbon-nitrogen hydrolase, partial [Pseudomonadota bacterium]